MTLYRDIRTAAATIMVLPEMLTITLASTVLENSVNTKCPANDRNTPRQKMPSECCPHTIAGQNTRDFNAGQLLGTSHTVITASDRKCRMRSTSRLVLSIG